MDREKLISTLKRVQHQRISIKREMELFYMFVFGVFFGVLSALMAAFWDSMVRGQAEYPSWYVIVICVAFLITLSVLFIIFLSLKRQRKDVEMMESNLEEMVIER